MAGHARHSDGRRRPRRSTQPSKQIRIALRRPVEAKQYVCIRYTERLVDAGIEPPGGSVGDSYDNALAESIIVLFKTEVIWPRGPWKSFETVEYDTLEWGDWFNNRRLL